MPLTRYEQETIINFNKEEKVAYIFTYEKSWQQHIEKRFKVKPVSTNHFGGKEYVLPKDRIRKPFPQKRCLRLAEAPVAQKSRVKKKK